MVFHEQLSDRGGGAGHGVLDLRKPYLLFLGDVTDPLTAKTAIGLRDWARDDLICQWRLEQNGVDLRLPDMDPGQAVTAGASSLIIGVAPAGGQLPDHWEAALVEAAEAGLDLVSGLHTRLSDRPAIKAAARKNGVRIYDVRHFDGILPIGTGRRRSGKRLLTVGVDCAVGKKYTALAIARAMKASGRSCDFRATGQTGIMIAGRGIAVDAVIADFISGAAELLSPDNETGHWDIIEGQGSLFHPSYAGVALGLLHGSQPDAIVLCADLDRTEIDGCPGFPIPTLGEALERNLEAARLTNPRVRCVGISLNTAGREIDSAEATMAQITHRFGVPTIDPLRWGARAIVDGLW